MAGMEDYFGPRRDIDDFEDYDKRPDFSYYQRQDSLLDTNVARRQAQCYRQEYGDIDNSVQSTRYISGFDEPVYFDNLDDRSYNRSYRNNEIKREQLGGSVSRPSTLFPSNNINTSLNQQYETESDILVLKYIKIGVSISTIIAENLLSHPFVVLRRQCQVNNSSQRFHVVPITLFPVILRLTQYQGISTFWKGIGSVLVVRGVSIAVEDFLSKFTPWPKEFKSSTYAKVHGQHIMLKCFTFAIVTPFYSASLVETVQSDIASDPPGVFDVFRAGIYRLVSWGGPQKGRMLPMWKLLIPTIGFCLLKYMWGVLIRDSSRKMLQYLTYKNYEAEMGAVPKTYITEEDAQDIEITSSFVASVVPEIFLYPIETIIHRLYIQGTRTIIDNLDSGTQVIDIKSNYQGAADCFHTIVLEEGYLGLYKGFGALILQFTAHLLFIKVMKSTVKFAYNKFRSRDVVPSIETPNISVKPEDRKHKPIDRLPLEIEDHNQRKMFDIESSQKYL